MTKRDQNETENVAKPASKQARDLPTRPLIERLQKIRDMLLSDECPNCKSMAEELRVKRRTILRDIEFLRAIRRRLL